MLPGLRFFRQNKFAGKRELIFLLLNVKLLHLHVTIVERGAEHHGIGFSIAPGEFAQLRPERRRGVEKKLRTSAEGKLRSVQRAINRFGETERLRDLGE